MSHIKKPSLPSIQFLLNESIDTSIIPTSPPITPPTKRHHSKQSSISSLPSELQQLSLSAPAYKYDIPERSENQQPSWMMMSPSSTPPPANNKRSMNSHHTRSISDLSMIQQPPSKHKRSASANTFHTSHHITNTTLPHIDEYSTVVRAHTESPPQSSILDSHTKQKKLLSDALNINNNKQHPTLFLNQVIEQQQQQQQQQQEESTKEKEYENVIVARDEHTGRYYCPFCNKAFNRPSSLRIHTYSHTGEKPFVCQEEGCGRKFSVQSNMRRHLRVHRLGRSSKPSSSK
jgi:uncharacterized Zn-finger protein